MRVTFLLPTFATRPAGGFRVVYEYANQLVRRGHELAVVHPRRPVAGVRAIARSPLHWLRIRAGRLRNAVITPTLRWHPLDPRVRMLFVPDAAERHIPRADAIVATWWATADEVLRYAPDRGEKFYLIQGYETWGGPPERVDATWRAGLHKIVVARWLYEQGLALGCPPDGLRHIPNAIDHSVFRCLAPVETRPPRVAMAFSEAEVKGGRDGIEALEIARAGFPDLQAVLFGIEPRPDGLPAWIEYVHNPPQRALVEEIYKGASLFLCSSIAEGWHLPGAEAMACGCALVATDCGGNRDYAEPGATALLSPPRDPAALAANLLLLLRDERLRVRLAAAGQERIREFTWERSAERFEAYLIERTGAKPAPAEVLPRPY